MRVDGRSAPGEGPRYLLSGAGARAARPGHRSCNYCVLLDWDGLATQSAAGKPSFVPWRIAAAAAAGQVVAAATAAPASSSAQLMGRTIRAHMPRVPRRPFLQCAKLTSSSLAFVAFVRLAPQVQGRPADAQHRLRLERQDPPHAPQRLPEVHCEQREGPGAAHDAQPVSAQGSAYDIGERRRREGGAGGVVRRQGELTRGKSVEQTSREPAS